MHALLDNVMLFHLWFQASYSSQLGDFINQARPTSKQCHFLDVSNHGIYCTLIPRAGGQDNNHPLCQAGAKGPAW